MLEAARNHSHCSNRIKMPKNTITCQIKSFIPIENMNVEKISFTKITQISLAKSVLHEFKKCPIWIMLFYVFFCNVILVNQFLVFYYINTFISSFLCIISLFVPYGYVSVESIEYIRLSSLAINAIL